MDSLLKHLADLSWHDRLAPGLRIGLIALLAILAILVLRIGLKRLEQRLVLTRRAAGELPTEASKRIETLIQLVRQGLSILLWVVAGLIVLRELGVEIAPLLAGAGIAGLAVGFGAQNLVRDVISGFFLILENQVRVGDVAVINGTGGQVEYIGFRTLRLRDLSGTVYIFPNGTITTLANKTQDWSAYVCHIGVAYESDLDQVFELMRATGAELRADPPFGAVMLEDVEIFGLEDFADSSLQIQGRIKTLPGKQWDVGREYRRRLKRMFDTHGIEIPYPQRGLNLSGFDRPIDVRMVDERRSDAPQASP